MLRIIRALRGDGSRALQARKEPAPTLVRSALLSRRCEQSSMTSMRNQACEKLSFGAATVTYISVRVMQTGSCTYGRHCRFVHGSGQQNGAQEPTDGPGTVQFPEFSHRVCIIQGPHPCKVLRDISAGAKA